MKKRLSSSLKDELISIMSIDKKRTLEVVKMDMETMLLLMKIEEQSFSKFRFYCNLVTSNSVE